ncbi:MAG: hypothetical protein NTV22_11605 [bacterium]|nr:hypothetical protein [bacterium]
MVAEVQKLPAPQTLHSPHGGGSRCGGNLDEWKDGAAAEAAAESTPGGVATKAELVFGVRYAVFGAAVQQRHRMPISRQPKTYNFSA